LSLAPITLTTEKSIAVIDNRHRRLRQDENGLSITVTVLNEDNTAYNLTGRNLVFCENKQDNKIVIDNGKGNNSGKFNRSLDNDTKGIFTYVLQEDVYAASGKAWFEITDGTTVDSTKDFYFDVEKDASISISNNDYIGSFKALETAMAGAQSKITSDLADMEAQTTKKIADTKAANEGEITQALKNLTDQTTVALSNVDEYTKKIATLQSQWDGELRSIKNKANTDTDSAVKAINDKYTNDFAKLKLNFTNWQNSTTKNYQKQVDDILALIQKDGTEVTDLQKQISDTATEIQNLNKPLSKIDFTLYARENEVNALRNTLNWKIVDSNPDTITYTSKSFLTNTINVPENTWGYLITNRGFDSPNRVTQEWWSDNGNTGQTAQHYYRQLTYATQKWSPWVAQATQNDVDSINSKISKLGSVKTVNEVQPDNSGNITIPADGVTSFNGKRGDINFKVVHDNYGSPQKAFDASKTEDGIHIYDPGNGSISAFVDGKTITDSKNHDTIIQLQQQYGNLQGTVNGNSANITQVQKDIIALQKAKPDLSGYETTTAVKTLADRITALENKKPIRASSQWEAVNKSKNSNDDYYW